MTENSEYCRGQQRLGDRGAALVSPGAGYDAVLRPDGSGLRGSGFAWYMESAYHRTTQTITATYLGPPDLDRCLRVIEDEAARGVTPN